MELYIAGSVMFLGYMVYMFEASRKLPVFILLAAVVSVIWPVAFVAFVMARSLDNTIFR